MLPVAEKEFMGAVVELAETLGFLAFHTFDSRKSDAGFPDLVLVKPPRVIFAELKSATGSTTIDQRRWLKALEACPGVEAFLWRPASWQQIVQILQRRPT